MTYDATCSTMSRLFSHELTQEDLFLKFCETEEDDIIWFRVVKKYFFSKKALLSVLSKIRRDRIVVEKSRER